MLTANVSKIKKKYPDQHYLYFERTYRKRNYFYQNGLIFKNVMLISKKLFFTNEAACTCVNICKNIITP